MHHVRRTRLLHGAFRNARHQAHGMPRIIRITVKNTSSVHRTRLFRVRQEGEHASTYFLLPPVQHVNQYCRFIQRHLARPGGRHSLRSRFRVHAVFPSLPDDAGFRRFRTAGKVTPHRLQRLYRPGHVRTAAPGGGGGDAAPYGKVILHVGGSLQNGSGQRTVHRPRKGVFRASERFAHQMQVQAGTVRVRTP